MNGPGGNTEEYSHGDLFVKLTVLEGRMKRIDWAVGVFTLIVTGFLTVGYQMSLALNTVSVRQIAHDEYLATQQEDTDARNLELVTRRTEMLRVLEQLQESVNEGLKENRRVYERHEDKAHDEK